MPRNRGTSRKGKPGKNERAVGLGKALQRSHGGGAGGGYQPRADGKSRQTGGGMSMQPGVASIGVDDDDNNNNGVAAAGGGGEGQQHRSVLELQDIDDFLMQADLANREFISEREGLVVLDATGRAAYQPGVQWADQQPQHKTGKTDFVFTELSVPRRPEWDETTTPQQLEVRERESFLEWRRGIAAMEEKLVRGNGNGSGVGGSASVTPFEKNLEVWRQLWRVMERSGMLLQLVDARNPLFYLSDDLRKYATTTLGKPMMVLINKSDYLSRKQRQAWYDYLTEKGWDVVFFSAVQEQQKLDAAAEEQRRMEEEAGPDVLVADDSGDDVDNDEDEDEESDPVKPDGDGEEQSGQQSTDGIGVETPLTREQLMETMMAFARKHDCQPDPRYENRIQFGMVGFPNVGKSSVINVLVGSSKHSHGIVRVAVASQPGKTKHFQTLMLPDSDEMMLCDCPGLVFPSFVSNTADLIAAGVYPIAQMRDHWPVIGLICQRIPREIINAHYGIHLPTPTEQEMRERGWVELPPPTADEFLTTFCVARSMLASSSGVPDYPRAARVVIKDYAEGKLLYCHPPPNVEEASEFFGETVATALHNTKKLRDKLLKIKQKGAMDAGIGNGEKFAGSDGNDEADIFVDDDLLELLGRSQAAETVSSGGPDKGGMKPKKHKWGKKDRKNRNKDPYGCHSSSPDDVLSNSFASSGGGVSVRAGKYSTTGYTRPTSFTGVKGAQRVEDRK